MEGIYFRASFQNRYCYSGNIFKDYCVREDTEHQVIATVVPRGNG